MVPILFVCGDNNNLDKAYFDIGRQVN